MIAKYLAAAVLYICCSGSSALDNQHQKGRRIDYINLQTHYKVVGNNPTGNDKNYNGKLKLREKESIEIGPT